MRLAFVLLDRPELPDPATVIEAFSSLVPELQLRVELGAAGDAAENEIATFVVSSGETLHVALLPSPIPNYEADEAAEFSVSALGTSWAPGPHVAHLAVVMNSRDATPSLESLSLFTTLLAAVVQSASALGVYWGDAGATHEPEFFVHAASDRDHPPLMLWSGVSIAADGPRRLSLLSLGMTRQLGFQNLLFTTPRTAANEGLVFFYDLLCYAVSLGGTVPDRHTVGRSDEERLVVRYEPSPIDEELPVWRVDLPD